MPRFPHTPALYLLAPLAGGITLAVRFAPAPGPLLALLGAGALAALISHLKNRARLFILSAFCALAAAGALRTVLLRDSQSDPGLLRCADSRMPVALEGVIDEYPGSPTAALAALDLGERLALDYGLAVATAELAWLDRALGQLSQYPLSAEAG